MRLFGRRTEVRDSHDRYANIEINYLLQRMEDYRGVSILATNRRSALDKAFTRRLAFVVEFPFPGREQAQAIWARAFPAAGADRHARFRAPGGIEPDRRKHQERRPEGGLPRRAVRRCHRYELVLEAARSEQRKIGQPLPDD